MTDAETLRRPAVSDTLSVGPVIGRTRLANGLDVVVIPDRRAPVVTHMIWYRTGSADDPMGKSGIAHFLEHLMFKGTAAFPDGAFSKRIADAGGQENAFTSYDYTAYFQRVAKAQLPAMMEMEADRMTGLILTDAVVAPERDVVLEERRMRVEGDPGQQLGEALMGSLYMHHPYGRPIIGFMHEIEGLGREDALAYYRRSYAPANATLLVAGDVEPQEVFALAERSYGRIAPGEALPQRQRVKEPPPVAARRVSVADAKVEQPLLQRYYLAPSINTGAPGSSEALEVLARVLGGGTTSRLYRALVMNDGPAASVGAHYSALALDDSRFGLYAAPRGDIPLDAVEEALDRELGRVIEEGVAPAELKRAQTRLVASLVYAQDSQYALAMQYGAALTVGVDAQTIAARPARLEAVTAEAVQQAATQVLQLRRSVTGLLVAA